MIAHDDIGATYVRLALHVEQHLPGYMDAYFGPSEWKTQAVAHGKQPLADLTAQARELAQAIQSAAMDAQRQRFLAKQAAAMQMTLRILAGERMPFIEEVQGVYDITPRRVDESVFENALRELDRLVRGEGTINDRLRARRKRFEIPREVARDLFPLAKDEVRRRTRQHFALPADEDVELSFVTDKPWGAYNWYLGKHRSLIEINTDSPLQANGLISLMTHEGYPGHHTEHTIKEQVVYERNGWLEGCVLPINAPECVISEGIATVAADVIFAEGEAEQWQRAEIYARAGVADDLAPEDVLRLQEAQRALSSVTGNAALMLHVDGKSEAEVGEYILRYSSRTPDEVKRNIRFLTDSLFRSYTFTYIHGHELLSNLFQRHDKIAAFKRVLTEPLTPTDLVNWSN